MLTRSAPPYSRIHAPSPSPPPQCVRMALLDAVEALELPPNALDSLIDRLGGPSAVAELTGRGKRMVRQQIKGSGQAGKAAAAYQKAPSIASAAATSSSSSMALAKPKTAAAAAAAVKPPPPSRKARVNYSDDDGDDDEIEDDEVEKDVIEIDDDNDDAAAEGEVTEEENGGSGGAAVSSTHSTLSSPLGLEAPHAADAAAVDANGAPISPPQLDGSASDAASASASAAPPPAAVAATGYSLADYIPPCPEGVTYTRVKRVATPGGSCEGLNNTERVAFQHGHKLVAIISEAASAGISLHADRGLPRAGRRRRVHITAEMSWSPMTQMQQLGRTSRGGWDGGGGGEMRERMYGY